MIVDEILNNIYPEMKLRMGDYSKPFISEV